MKNIFVLLFSGILISAISCNNSPEDSSYFDNVDQQKAHCIPANSNMLRFDKAHSGKFVYKINKESPFSGTFDMVIKDLNVENPKRAIISAWVFIETLESEPELVFEFRDEKFGIVDWVSLKAKDVIQNEKEWTKVKFEIDLTQKNRNNSQNHVR